MAAIFHDGHGKYISQYTAGAKFAEVIYLFVKTNVFEYTEFSSECSIIALYNYNAYVLCMHVKGIPMANHARYNLPRVLLQLAPYRGKL